MIRHISGRVLSVTDTTIVVDVHGIGYLIHISVPGSTFELEKEVSLFTYLAVRETALDLYGFQDRDTLEVFELLITLPKIGPKSAMQILSQADITLLKQAVHTNDASYLSKMSGIGKKSAEKIVAGLKDKFDNDALISTYSVTEQPEATTVYARDTIDALISLGYSADEARKVTHRISQEYPEVNTSADALKVALKLLSN